MRKGRKFWLLLVVLQALVLSLGIQNVQSQEFEMKAELKRLAKLDTFPGNPGFYNSQAVRLYKQELEKTTERRRRYSLTSSLIWQYIFSGYPDSALFYMDKIPEHVWETARLNNPAHDRNMMTALCHLRDGEQRNCQDNHNRFSCIMPLNEEAQHKHKTGSEKAIEYYLKVLSRTPNNYTARWLLNIAYMTLGKYPESVPEPYLVDFKKYPQDATVPYFNNLAGELGVSTLTYYGGTVLDDFNNDGFLDVFTTSGDLETNVELYLNNGKGGFDHATDKAGLVGITGGGNATHADYNNDGHIDLYVIRGGWVGENGKFHPNSLLKNNGDGTFTDVTKEVGQLDYYPCHTASWADFNNDGWVDLFVGNENGVSQLFENTKGSFKEVGEKAGLYTSRFVKGSYWGDYNKDGNIDLYVSVFEGENHLFQNNGPDDNGHYQFEDVAVQAGVNKPVRSFPTFFFDFNNDGFLDIFCASYPMNTERMAQQYVVNSDEPVIEYSSLYINNQDGTFRDVAESANLNRSIEAMGLNFGDIDNDGHLDFYAGTGFPALDGLMPNLMFRNDGGKQFLEVSNAGFGHLQKGHGIGFGDIDNDGDQDLYVSMGGFMEADKFWNILLENPGNENNWITLNLVGVTSNRSAIGAEITIRATDGNDVRNFYRVVSPGGSFGSSSLQQEIGLGKCTKIQSIEVNWPSSKKTQLFKNAEINRAYKVVEGRKKMNEIKLKKIQLKGEAAHHHHHHH